MPPFVTALRVLAPLGALALLAVLVIAPARADTPVQIAIGSTAVCALTDAGEIGCWGFDIPLVSDTPHGAFTDLSLGPTDACAITADGSAACWGAGYTWVRAGIDAILASDPEANLRLGGLEQLMPPDRTDLVQIVVHPWRHYACARTDQGEVVCWGRPLPDSPSPDGANFTQLISTGRELCALDSEGRTTCWGDLSIDRFVSDAGPFVRIASSGNGLCGVTAQGDVRCRTVSSRTAPGPPQPYVGLFRNVHVIGAQGCAIAEDGSLQCRQTHHWCHHLIPEEIDYCPADFIRFQHWRIDFTILFEGGPDRETTTARSYTSLFGDQAACAITTEGHVDCWSDFRDDPRHHVPERFRPSASPTDLELPADEGEQPSNPSPSPPS